MTKLFSVPADFKQENVEYFASLNEQASLGKVYELYGNLNPSPYGSGRLNTLLPKVDAKKLKEYIDSLNSVGIRFNYTFNSLCFGGNETIPKQRRKIVDYLRFLQDIGVSTVTVANVFIMDLVRTYLPELEIVVSTIAGVDSVSKAKAMEQLGASRVVLHEDQQRNFPLIRTILRETNLDVEVFVNSSCLYMCPYRTYHRLTTSHPIGSQPWLSICKIQRLEQPVEILKAKGWIRPEDTKYYYREGVRFFKIVGREVAKTNPDALLKVVQVYLQERHEGNLMDLFTFFSDTSFLSTIKIPNEKLEGFLRYFIENDVSPQCLRGCVSCKYCYAYAEKYLQIDAVEANKFIASFRERLINSLKI